MTRAGVAAEEVSGLPAVWEAVDRLAPRPVDVVDPALLRTLVQGWS